VRSAAKGRYQAISDATAHVGRRVPIDRRDFGHKVSPYRIIPDRGLSAHSWRFHYSLPCSECVAFVVLDQSGNVISSFAERVEFARAYGIPEFMTRCDLRLTAFLSRQSIKSPTIARHRLNPRRQRSMEATPSTQRLQSKMLAVSLYISVNGKVSRRADRVAVARRQRDIAYIRFNGAVSVVGNGACSLCDCLNVGANSCVSGDDPLDFR